MKRKTILVLCMIAITITISAYGKKDKAENQAQEAITKAEEANKEEIVEETVEDVSEADTASFKYESFLAGDEKVYVDKYDDTAITGIIMDFYTPNH